MEYDGPTIDDHTKIFKRGMRVRIKSPASATNSRFSLVSSMLNMINAEHCVNDVERDRVWIGGFMWSGEDLIIVDENYIASKISGDPIKIDVVQFNPENLTI